MYAEYVVSIEDNGNKTKLNNGLYSTDGFASYDDSSSLIIIYSFLYSLISNFR